MKHKLSCFILVTCMVIAMLGMPGCGGGSDYAEGDAKDPVANPYLSSALFGITHFDPSQSDSIPYGPPKGTFNVDPLKQQISPGGPVNIVTLASTSDSYMWAVGSDRVSYVDVSGSGWREVARENAPAYLDALPLFGERLGPINPETHKKVGGMIFEDKTLSQVEKILSENYGPGYRLRIANGIYSVVDRNNVLYANFGNGVYAFSLKDGDDPSSGIEIKYKMENAIKEIDVADTAAVLCGLTMTYDGFLVINFSNGIAVVDKTLKHIKSMVSFSNEITTNSIAIDEKNGIYVATDKNMRKLVWTGTRLSEDEAHGAWSSAYDFSLEPPPIVKHSTGTGSTPTLMGFGDDPDKLVVITDGSKRMNLVAFWRDDIPDDFVQQDGTASRRIAGQIEVTCGLDNSQPWIQSEQSVVVRGYGAFVVNNLPLDADSMARVNNILGVTTLGTVFTPSFGVERFRWDTENYQWNSVWSRNDVSSTSMVPIHSQSGNMALVSGYYNAGWEVTGMDWNTGETVHRTLFGKTNYGNGAYAILQYFPNGDLLFNSLVGPYRVSYP